MGQVNLDDTGRVLVCEDDAATRALLSDALNAAGLIVEVAPEGRAGLARATASEPDAIVADWLMPGLDGISLCAAAREVPALEHTHIVLVTGRTEAQYAQMATDAGADAVVTKPFDPDQLARRVVAGVRRSRLRRRGLAASRTDYATGLRDERCLREDLARLSALSAALARPFPIAVAALCGLGDFRMAGLADALVEVLGPADALYWVEDGPVLVAVAPDADELGLLEAALVEAARKAGVEPDEVRHCSVLASGGRPAVMLDELFDRLQALAAV